MNIQFPVADDGKSQTNHHPKIQITGQKLHSSVFENVRVQGSKTLGVPAKKEAVGWKGGTGPAQLPGLRPLAPHATDTLFQSQFSFLFLAWII